MVPEPGQRQQHGVAGAGEAQHGEEEGLVAAGGDGDLVGAIHAAIGGRQVGGVGFAQLEVAVDEAVARVSRVGGRLGEMGEDAGVRR